MVNKPDPNELTRPRSSGAPTFGFPSKQNAAKNKLLEGSEIEGEVTHREVTQQTDPEDWTVKLFWDADPERPKWQLVITLQTKWRDPEIEGDDGKRRIFAKYKMLDAISDAVNEVGAPGVEVGGYLKVVHDDIIAPESKARSATKLFSATYTSLADRVASGATKVKPPVVKEEEPETKAEPVEEKATPATNDIDQEKAAAALAAITDPALRAKIGLPPL